MIENLWAWIGYFWYMLVQELGKLWEKGFNNLSAMLDISQPL